MIGNFLNRDKNQLINSDPYQQQQQSSVDQFGGSGNMSLMMSQMTLSTPRQSDLESSAFNDSVMFNSHRDSFSDQTQRFGVAMATSENKPTENSTPFGSQPSGRSTSSTKREMKLNDLYRMIQDREKRIKEQDKQKQQCEDFIEAKKQVYSKTYKELKAAKDRNKQLR